MSFNKLNKILQKNSLLIPVFLLTIFFVFSFIYFLSLASSSNKNISYANAEAYTELYFTPTQTVKKNIFLINNLKFSFAIHNVESNDITYTYQIIFSKNGKRIILKQNNVFVENNQTKVLVESIPVTKDYSNGKITVLILNNNQQITLHLPNAS